MYIMLLLLTKQKYVYNYPGIDKTNSVLEEWNNTFITLKSVSINQILNYRIGNIQNKFSNDDLLKKII